MPSNMVFRRGKGHSHGDAKAGARGASPDGHRQRPRARSRRADSGLGRKLVDGFAQQLGGQVERKSDSQGTTVHLILPSRETHRDQLRSSENSQYIRSCHGDETRPSFNPKSFLAKLARAGALVSTARSRSSFPREIPRCGLLYPERQGEDHRRFGTR